MTFTHAGGDPSVAAELTRLAGRRTGRTAVALVDLTATPCTRTAFLGAEENSRFEIGSITKPLTGMLLAEAVCRGEVSLDTRVGTLVPGSAAVPLGSVTMRELCTHTSGLPRIPRGPKMWGRALSSALLGLDPYRGSTPAGVFEAAARKRLVHRGRYRYSNLGAAVLGQSLAIAAGSDYPALLRDRVLAPIGMAATSVGGEPAPRGRTAAGRRTGPWTMDAYAPAGGAVSTVADLAALATALLSATAPGQGSLDPVLSREGKQPGRSTGMFWIIDTVRDGERTMVWHNGRTGGYSSFLALYPQAGRAVVVLADTARSADQQRIALGLAELGKHQ